MVTRFFSVAGRTSPARFAACVAVAVVLLWAAARALQSGGLATFLLVGAIWGLLVAKLGVEAARRMHDQGRRGRMALPIIGVAVIAFVASMMRWLGSGPDSFFELSMIVLILGLAIAFLRPGSARARTNDVSASTGGDANRPMPVVLGAALLTLAGADAGAGYGLFSWSEGVRRVHEANARDAAAYRPGPDPLAQEYGTRD